MRGGRQREGTGGPIQITVRRRTHMFWLEAILTLYQTIFDRLVYTVYGLEMEYCCNNHVFE